MNLKIYNFFFLDSKDIKGKQLAYNIMSNCYIYKKLRELSMWNAIYTK